MRVTRAVTLAEVPAAEWDSLAGDDLYLSHAWLAAGEADPSATVGYLLAHRGDRLVGALPCFEVAAESNSAYLPDRYRTQLGVDGHWLLVGTRRAYRSGLLLHPGLDSAAREEAAAGLVAAARGVARDRALRGLVSLFTPTGTAALLLRSGGVAVLDTAEAVLVTGGRSLAAFAASLSGHRRRGVRRELASFDRAGYEAGVEPLSGCAEEVAPLLRNVQQRYGHPATVAEMREYVVGLLGLPDPWIAFTLRDRGRLIGCAVMCPRGRTLHGRFVGFDYTALRGAYEYFVLAFYRPVDWMAEHGLDRLHLGIDAADAKVQRGATLSPLWTVAVPADAGETLPPAPPAVDGWRRQFTVPAPPDVVGPPWSGQGQQ